MRPCPWPGGGGGRFELTAGRRYAWANASFWKANWGFTDDADRILVQFHPRPALLKTVTAVAIADCTQPDVPLLVTLGWYLLVLMSDESAAAMAVMS